MLNGLQASIYSGFPTLLVNPAFLSFIMIVLTGGDCVLFRYLKSRFQHEPHPVIFTSDYRKVTLDLSEILYVESRDTEVWVCATDGRKFRNKAGITSGIISLGKTSFVYIDLILSGKNRFKRLYQIRSHLRMVHLFLFQGNTGR